MRYNEQLNHRSEHGPTESTSPVHTPDPAGWHPGSQPTQAESDEERQIKVLSPAMLVLKRFQRNQLAIVGVICLTAMFIFSFMGGWLMPYGEKEVFTEYVDMAKDYASVTENTDLRFTEVSGQALPLTARADFFQALRDGKMILTSDKLTYWIEKPGTDLYLIHVLNEVARTSSSQPGEIRLTAGFQAPASFADSFLAALGRQAESFMIGEQNYVIARSGKFVTACQSQPVALASYNVFDFASADLLPDFNFQYQAELAIRQGLATFTVDGLTYELESDGTISRFYRRVNQDRQLVATLSRFIIQAAYADVYLSLPFKDTVKKAITSGQGSFSFTDAGDEVAYTLVRNNNQWSVKKLTQTLVIKSYQNPSLIHWLGTDGNGMDILTRLMYGGRISLMIGFIVVFIELTIGVILGGISGYFGKWLDNLLMRIVDIFNCIPSTPLIIIIGAMMDAFKIDPQIRMVYLMLILGLLGWPGIARLVRGQILSLREQEFMIAAEATGLSVRRKIFRHLVPNVIPQLIVVSTMSLGETILIESVLSFLGLGVKYPFASWGNIINAVSNVHVMTHYWFVWIPAGFCILITVLGFNFIGDGLRDAFDPKMK